MTAQQSSPPARPAKEVEGPTSVGGVVDMIKAYAKQETLGPLRGAGRWLAMGSIGAALLGLGLSLVILGLLRLVQAEWTRSARGSLSWLAYAIVLLVCAALAVLAAKRISRDRLNKESK